MFCFEAFFTWQMKRTENDEHPLNFYVCTKQEHLFDKSWHLAMVNTIQTLSLFCTLTQASVNQPVIEALIIHFEVGGTRRRRRAGGRQSSQFKPIINIRKE